VTEADLDALFDTLMNRAIRKQVRLLYADYLLLHAIGHRGVVLKLKPDPRKRASQWAALPHLPIPTWKYIRLILHLRETGLVEFDGERKVTSIRLSTKGEEWARGEGLLPS
jgi:hypothetical protein